jgi:protein-glutamine gamma-glutamyltransferase
MNASAATVALPSSTPRSWREAPLAWTTTSLAIAMLLHATHTPFWVTAVFALLVTWRTLLGVKRARLPSTLMRYAATFVVVLAVVVKFRTLNGLDAGTALLILVAGLKLLETRGPRDHVVLVLISYVLVLAAFLYEQAWWLLPVHALAIWVATTTLLRVTHESLPSLPPSASLRLAGRMLLQALPMMVVLFLLFPRVPGPFWALPSAETAVTGLSDEMSPGDVSELSLLSDPAFRVRFHGAVPPPEERYWRGPVLRQFDGFTWRRGSTFVPRSPVVFTGERYAYTLMLERNRNPWVFALDLPEVWPRSQLFQRLDYQLVSTQRLDRPTSFLLSSRTRYRIDKSLPRSTARADTALPTDRNLRSIEFARTLRAQSAGAEDFSNRVLALFATQGFEYTLTPPRLEFDSVDEFLFRTRSGFCGHYASAFTTLMRAGGVPARVVTGYQGGEPNRMSNYYIVRQSDAHAWSEIWLEGRGWVRVDPTAAVAPERVRRGIDGALSEDEPVPDRLLRSIPWLEDVRFAWDAVNTLWRERVVEFSEESQAALLERLGIRESDWRTLATLLVAGVVIIIAVLAWQLHRELKPAPADPVQKAYLLFCRRLQRRGLQRLPHEGPRDFARRVRSARPDLAPESDAIFSLYEAVRYGCSAEAAEPAIVAQLRALVRKFHPRAERRNLPEA